MSKNVTGQESVLVIKNKRKGKLPAKKEAGSNLPEHHGEYIAVYTNTLELHICAVTKVIATHPRTVKAHSALKENMFFNRKAISVL